MLALDDPKWPTLLGGYQTPFDASVPIRRIESGQEAWPTLWENLHHQGDIGESAYAAIPQLVRICESIGTDWNLYALAATVEVERHRRSNPALPDWAKEAYRTAWQHLVRLALRDLATSVDGELRSSALSVVALGRGDLKLGALLAYLDESELDELVENRLAWSKLYA